METQSYDIIIIGAGPGGYLAAQRAGSEAKKVLLVEKDQNLGGVCLNRGCIPTKSLLNSAKIYYKSRNSQELGVQSTGTTYDLKKAMTWKNQVVGTLTKGITYQMKRHNVTVLHGRAHVIDRSTVSVNDTLYRADHLLIATGSSPAELNIPGSGLDHVLNSDQILEISSLPSNLTIIGGGVVGLEFASYFSMLGVSVTVIEMLPEILPQFDSDMAVLLRKSLNCEFVTDAKVEKIDRKKVHYIKNGEKSSCPADVVLIATGRKPNTTGFGLEDINLDFNSDGIRVNEKMQTNQPNVYAIGDVTGKAMLAHAAYRMGEVAVNVILGRDDRMRYCALPWVVYTYPELSGVGMTETRARIEGRKIEISKMPLSVNGRYLAEHINERGLCKVVIDAQTRALLGVSIIGGVNSEIIMGAAAMIESELRVQEIREIMFPHPTVSEIIRDSIRAIN
jgi:dihydrolipoamide dehydrogenase